MKVLDPSITVPNIKLTIDPHIEGTSTTVLHHRGNTVPLLQFGESVIDWSSVERFRLDVGYTDSHNIIPTIDVVVDDSNGYISTYIANNPDIGICRYGYKDWGIRFLVLYNSVTNNGNKLRLSGTLYNEKFHTDAGQTSYKDMTINDTIKQLCQDINIGMYTYDNSELNKQRPFVTNSSMSHLSLINNIISRYTANMWCIDPNYYLHIGDMNTIISQDTATYTLSQIDYEQMEQPQPIIFLSKPYNSTSDTNIDNKIKCDYSFDKQLTDRFVKLRQSYTVYNNDGVFQNQSTNFGLGSETTNTFSGFVSHINPYTKHIIGKDMSKQVIKLITNNIIPEINPFDVVECELYRGRMLVDTETNPNDGKELEQPTDFDIEHSGKKVVIGYTVQYRKNETINENTSRMYQQIYVM